MKFLHQASWVALLPAMTACTLTIVEPKEGSIHVEGNGVPLLARTNGDIRSHSVSVNGQPVSPPVPRSTPQELNAILTLGLGTKRLAVSTTVACSNCPGGQTTLMAERLVCVRPAIRYAGTFTSVLGNAAGNVPPLAWGAVPIGNSLQARAVFDSAGPMVSWSFTRLAGAFSSIGVIESVEQPCRCLRSDSATPGAPLVH